MPVTVQNATPRHNAASLSIFADRPANIAVGELMVAHVFIRGGTSGGHGVNNHPDWNYITDAMYTAGSAAWSYYYWKRCTQADLDAAATSTWTWTQLGSVVSTTTVLRVIGAKTSGNPITVFGSVEGAGPFVVPSIDIPVESGLLYLGGNQSATTWTSTGTEHYDSGTGTGGTSRSVAGYSEPSVPAGASGTRTLSTSGGGSATIMAIEAAPTTTYVLKTANSDLAGGVDFNKVLSEETEPATGITVTISASSTEDSFGFTPSNTPGSQGGQTGSFVYVAKANISAGGANLRYLNVGVARVNSSGVVQAGPFFGTEVTASTAIHTFNITANLGTFAAGDRLRVTYRFREGNGIAWSPTLQAGTLNTSVLTPWAMDVVAPAIPTGLIGAGLSHN